MDPNQTLEGVLRKQLAKWRTDLLIVTLWGEDGAPIKRKELEELIEKSEKELEKYGHTTVTRPNPIQD